MFKRKGEPLCREVRGMFSEYIDNRLDSENKSLVERHLESCEACARELESLRMTVQLLRRVPEVPTPRSFTIAVPQPRREGAFGPAGLRWLRPATAVVTIALMVLLMGDLLNAFPGAVVTKEPGNLTLSAKFGESVSAPVPTEPPIMVNVPGVMGQMSLATAKAVGYQDYTIVRSAPTSQEVASGLTASDHEGLIGAGAISPPGKTGAGWPLRQTEIGLGVVLFVLLALMLYARRQRRKSASAR